MQCNAMQYNTIQPIVTYGEEFSLFLLLLVIKINQHKNRDAVSFVIKARLTLVTFDICIMAIMNAGNVTINYWQVKPLHI